MMVIFYICAFLAVLSSLGMLIARHPLHSALCMIGTMVSLAVIFLLNHADFIAVLQIAVYAGAVMMLMIFVVFLVDAKSKQSPVRFGSFKGIGIVMGGIIVATLAAFTGKPLLASGDMTEAALLKQGSVEFLADKLFGQYLLPFEAASILLLVGLVGAVALAKKKL
ncbi:NADH-quinone oxidoreductase subunit J [bacterium]|nr:MAG: NADH-quinone oxidoreductase subunit J [bacterium]